MILFCVGFVCGVGFVCVHDVVTEWRKPLNCDDCGKLVHRCYCEGGS